MTIENIENHMAYTCQCGGVNFALLKSGAIECNKCSTPLDDVKWWAGGMGAQITRAIKAEAERDQLRSQLEAQAEAVADFHGLPFSEAKKSILELNEVDAKGIAISLLIQNGILKKQATHPT